MDVSVRRSLIGGVSVDNNKLTIAALRAYIDAKEEFLRRYGFRTLPDDKAKVMSEISDAKRLLNLFNDERAHVEVSDEA